MQNWYEVQAREDGAEIMLFDVIGAGGVSAQQFINDLRAIEAPAITLLINSPGGCVFEGLAIYNAVRRHPAKITARIEGIAASAASLVAMAAGRIVMPANAFMMVHNPWTAVQGEADDLRDMAETLDRVRVSLMSAYTTRTGLTEVRIAELLDAETWLTAEEAVELGFADEIEAELRLAARFNLDRLPEAVRNAFSLPTAPKAANGLMQSIRDQAAAAGLADYANVWLLDPGITSADQARASIAEAREIADLCAFAGTKERTDEFIRSRVSLSQVRTTLINARADEDMLRHTDGHPPSSTASGDTKAIWQARRSMR